MLADERFKAANVRYCPHCGLQCLRTDGCDTVTCGRDAEDKGNKIQYGKGCMKKFNWEAAARCVGGLVVIINRCSLRIN